MKRLKLISTIAALLVFASACSNVDSKEESKKTLFYMEDTINDDNGYGEYTYPTDKLYQEGSFDIEEFAIYETENYYEFYFKIGTNFKNDLDYFNGWDVQMFDVYLQLGEGKHTMALSGRNVKFNEKWDKAILISPERTTKVQREVYDKNTEVADCVSNYEDIARDVIIPETYMIDYDTISARVPKGELEGIENLKGVQAFSLGFDIKAGGDNTYNMLVEKYAGKANFGGGSNYDGNSNVIDMIGTNEKLKNYVSKEGYEIYPVVDFIKVK